AAGLPIGNRRNSTARPSRHRIARSVWSAAYPAALVVADEFVLRAPCELGNEKRRDTPHSKRFATSQLASGLGLAIFRQFSDALLFAKAVFINTWIICCSDRVSRSSLRLLFLAGALHLLLW